MKSTKRSIIVFLLFILSFSLFALDFNVAEHMDNNDGSLTNSFRNPNAQLAMAVTHYPVTMGDVYTLTFAANGSAVRYVIPVDTSYTIRVANLGTVNCKDMNFMQLKSKVEAIVSRNYPLSGVQFVLSSPSTFLVTVCGEVKQTAEVEAWSLTRLSTVVRTHFTPYSSERKVTIISSDGKISDYDLFAAKRYGDLSQDPFLRPDDKILVNRMSRTVTIGGAVERPGTYELLEGENLKALIEKYGNGLAPLADTSRIELYRNNAEKNYAGEKIYLKQEDIDKDTALICYDSVSISSFKDLMPVVFIEGAVRNANAQADELQSSNRIVSTFNDGEDYSYFIRRNRAWFSSISDTEKAYVVREGKNIPLNLNPMLYDASYYANFAMQTNDVLVVPFRQYFVSVAGAVNKPGRYPYIPDRTWEYYIGLAGGFVETQNSLAAVKIVDVNGNVHDKKEVVLPEYTITAQTNSFLYYFNQYAPIITTLLSVVGTTLSVIAVVQK